MTMITTDRLQNIHIAAREFVAIFRLLANLRSYVVGLYDYKWWFKVGDHDWPQKTLTVPPVYAISIIKRTRVGRRWNA
jgi:hypothetical protein